MEPAIGKNGSPVTIQIDTRSGSIRAKVWRVKVGRCDLLLLDSNVEGNAPEDRELTSQLYGGDGRMRIRQELLLGVGGVRALRAMGITPGVFHMNEGHSGFAVLEAIRTRMEEEGISFDQACRALRAKWSSPRTRRCPPVTTAFDADLIEEHLGPLREDLGISHDRLMALGRENPGNYHEEFCMTVLGLKLSRRANAVSALHGEVSRAMWTGLYPGQDRRRGPDRPHHQRRARAVVAGAADVPPLRPASRRRTGTSTAARHASGKASRTSTMASSGRRI